MKLEIEHVLFWFFIVAALAVVLWLLHGSPTVEDALISITVFLLGSEIMLWREHFKIDKKMAISFERIKNDIGNVKREMEQNHEKASEILLDIQNNMQRKRRG